MAEDETGGVTVTHDELIDQIHARADEEYARQSDAGESAAKVDKFLEKTQLNSQAFSWSKSIMKKRKKKDGDAKALDVIRSLEITLPMLKSHILGQGTGELGLGDPADYVPEGDEEDEPDEDDIDEDADDFEQALGDLDDDEPESNVTKLAAASK